MKILLSAYSCGPTKTSEPGNAWRAVNHALAEGHEVWTIAEKDHYEADTLAYLAEHPMPGYHPLFFSLEGPVKRLRTSGMIGAVYYHLWQRRLMAFAAELHARIGFDLAHHITFGRYWSPSGVRNLGIPFIWGPVGAAESAPRPFVVELPWREQLFEFIRDGVRSVSRLDPALRDTARRAAVAIGITREACAAMRDLGARRIEQLPQGSLPDDDLEILNAFPPPPDGPLQVTCLGRLLHWKGFHLAIRTFALYGRNHPEAELWIAGSGPFLPQLKKIAARCGARVKFLGSLSHAETMRTLAQSHVLLHPALHEAFGNVCMEAMAAGRPVICLDIGGPASQVTNECGFVVPAATPGEAIPAMAAILERLDADRALLADLSVKARERVRDHFTMRKMGAALSGFYREVTADRAG